MTLSPQQKNAIRLRRANGMPVATIAAKLHLSVNTVAKVCRTMPCHTRVYRKNQSKNSASKRGNYAYSGFLAVDTYMRQHGAV